MWQVEKQEDKEKNYDSNLGRTWKNRNSDVRVNTNGNRGMQ